MFNFFFRRSRQNRNLIYNIISNNDIRDMVNNPNNILIDVRSKKEYDTMHIINSVNIPLEFLRNNENEYKNKEAIIVYCSTGVRTKEAIKILNSLGYMNVYIWMYGSIANFPYKDMIKI